MCFGYIVYSKADLVDGTPGIFALIARAAATNWYLSKPLFSATFLA